MAVVLSQGGSVPKRPRRSPKPLIPALLLLVTGACAVFLIMGLSGYKDMRDMVLTWTEIAGIASTEDPDAPDEYIEQSPGGEPETVVVSAQAPLEESKDYLYKPINLKALREINSDVSGYIYIPGTNVDYPILKESEPEEYFYIDHNMYKASDQYGSIFELCDEERGEPGIDNPVTWLFGHHMSSGSMFATLYNYEDPDFWDTPVYIYRDDWRGEYQVIGYCYVDKNDSVYAFSDYARGSSEYQWLLEYLKENNSMDAERTWPTDTGDLTVLSTCYGRAGTSRRMVLLCREVRRAMVPEYYNSIKDIEQYGGDSTPIEAPEDDNDNKNQINGMGDLLNGGGG